MPHVDVSSHVKEYHATYLRADVTEDVQYPRAHGTDAARCPAHPPRTGTGSRVCAPGSSFLFNHCCSQVSDDVDDESQVIRCPTVSWSPADDE